MGLFTVSSKLTGTPGVSGWTQIHEYIPADLEKLNSRGCLFAVISTSSTLEGMDAVLTGREILARLHEEYYGNKDKTPYNALKTAVEKITAEFGGEQGDIEIVAGAFIKGAFYVSGVGGSQVSIFRNGGFAKILISSEEKVVSASGYPLEHDFLILSTKGLLENVAQGVLRAALIKADVKLVVEAITPLIIALPDSSRMGLILIKFIDSPVPIENIQKNMEAKIWTDKGMVNAEKKGNYKMAEFVKKLYRFKPSKEIFIRRKEDQSVGGSKKSVLVVGSIFLLLLLISIIFGIRQKSLKDKKSQYESRLSQAQHNYEEAVSIFAIDTSRSRELFAQSKELVDVLISEGVTDPTLDNLKSQILASESDLLGIYKIEPELFVDLALLTAGFESKSAIYSADSIYILATSQNKIVRTDIDTKKSQVIVGPEKIADITSFAVYDGGLYVVKNDGIYEVKGTLEKVIDKDWEGEMLTYAYASNLYVLDKVTSSIYRYVGVEGGFSKKHDWLVGGSTVNLTNANLMIIDGSIWTLASDEITKYTFGNQVAFEVSEVPDTLSKPSSIFVSDETQYLYALEKERNRIVVLTKDGKYVAQYVSESLSDAVQIIVASGDKKIIILSKDKIYLINCEHPIGGDGEK